MSDIIVKALDALGYALAEHGHVWTNEERSLYERAISFCGDYMDSDL